MAAKVKRSGELLGRTAWIMDPAGHVWTIATRMEETTEEERQDRWSGILSGRQERQPRP